MLSNDCFFISNNVSDCQATLTGEINTKDIKIRNQKYMEFYFLIQSFDQYRVTKNETFNWAKLYAIKLQSHLEVPTSFRNNVAEVLLR